MNSVVAVICNYNKKDFVLGCIESVLASNFKDFDLIVVDNASTDGSLEAIIDQFGNELTILVNEENLGGSGGFHRGMQYAMDKGVYDYIHLLDNDIIVDKDAIGSLYDYMEKNEGTGVCGSLILRMDQPDFIQDYGAMIEIGNLGVRPLFHATKDSNDLPNILSCDYVAACSAMYRTSVLKQVGIIDQNFFIYWDDMSLSWEIRLAGYRVQALRKSKVWHAHGIEEQTNTFGIYYFFRNKLYSFIKYCDDKDYQDLCDNLMKRLFRIFATNKDNPEVISTYLHALNDAANDVRGKAADHIIKPISYVDEKFANTFADKKKILLVCATYEFNFTKLIKKLKSVTDSEIVIQTNYYEVPRIEGIKYRVRANKKAYDAVIKVCPHVLDEKKYDRSYRYIDRYMNQILDDADFDFVEHLDVNFAFFYHTYYGYFQEKFDVLRKRYRG